MYRVRMNQEEFLCPDRETLKQWWAEGRLHDGATVLPPEQTEWVPVAVVVAPPIVESAKAADTLAIRGTPKRGSAMGWAFWLLLGGAGLISVFGPVEVDCRLNGFGMGQCEFRSAVPIVPSQRCARVIVRRDDSLGMHESVRVCSGWYSSKTDSSFVVPGVAQLCEGPRQQIGFGLSMPRGSWMEYCSVEVLSDLISVRWLEEIVPGMYLSRSPPPRSPRPPEQTNFLPAETSTNNEPPAIQVREDVDPLDGSTQVTVFITSSDAIDKSIGIGTYQPTLIIRCKRKKTEVYLSTEAMVDVSDYMSNSQTISIRIDGRSPERLRSSVSTDHKALFFSGAIAFAKKLMPAKELYVEWQELMGSRRGAHFEVEAIDDGIARLRKECKW